MMMQKQVFFIFFIFLLSGFVDSAFAAPGSRLQDRHWLTHKERETASISHAMWNIFLAEYVHRGEDGINRVVYSEVSEEDKQNIRDYLTMLQGVRISTFNRNEQMAFWINMYNAITVNLILEAYPVNSIRDISGGFFSFGPWDKKRVIVEGRELSLNNIEHNILRPIWKDPRIHYAVNCAALSCPNLALQSYTGKTIESMLDSAARDYVNNKRGARIETFDKLNVSIIYFWYKEDFGGSNQGIIEHLKLYADEPLRSKLSNDIIVISDSYDWRLNDLRR